MLYLEVDSVISVVTRLFGACIWNINGAKDTTSRATKPRKIGRVKLNRNKKLPPITPQFGESTSNLKGGNSEIAPARPESLVGSVALESTLVIVPIEVISQVPLQTRIMMVELGILTKKALEPEITYNEAGQPVLAARSSVAGIGRK